MKILKILLLGLLIGIFMLACTPAQLKTADTIQEDINAATPLVTQSVDIGLTVTGNAALVPANNLLSKEIQAGQSVLTQTIESPLAITPPLPTNQQQPVPTSTIPANINK